MASRWRVLSLGLRTVAAPRHPGVYVVYLGGRVVYVGSSWSLGERFPYHGLSRIDGTWTTPWGESPYLVVKYKISRRFGDWLMDEIRLIRRLNPSGNKQRITARRLPSIR